MFVKIVIVVLIGVIHCFLGKTQKLGTKAFLFTSLLTGLMVGAAGILGGLSMEDDVDRFALIIIPSYLLFYNMIHWLFEHLKESADAAKVQAAVQELGERRAEQLLEKRDEEVFQALLQARLQDVASEKAELIIRNRDQVTFQQMLSERVEIEFEKKLRLAIESGAQRAIEERLEQERQNAMKCNIDTAVWVEIQGGNKTLSQVFGVDDPGEGKVFAVPHWVFYKNGKPRVLRHNVGRASVILASNISFVSSRWSKVDGQAQILIGNAIINAPI